jgi:hypothetical protein
MKSSNSPPPSEANPIHFAPLVETCSRHGIGRSWAFELARTGELDTFLLGKRRMVYLDSIRSLPVRLAMRGNPA